jgi:cyclohexanone monooxygenase
VPPATEQGIRTTDGEEHRLDTIVFGTGFRANEYLSAVDIYGRDGRRLRDEWRDGAEAYLGLSVAGYPNLFTLYGPNTNGVTSIIFIHQAQANYVMGALRAMARRRVGSFDVRRRVMDRYNRKLQAALDGTVWTAGCTNYFRARNGKIVTQLPYSGRSYWLRTRLFHPALYRATR